MSPADLGTVGAVVLLAVFLAVAAAYTWALWRIVGALVEEVNRLIAEVGHLRERGR